MQWSDVQQHDWKSLEQIIPDPFNSQAREFLEGMTQQKMFLSRPGISWRETGLPLIPLLYAGTQIAIEVQNIVKPYQLIPIFQELKKEKCPYIDSLYPTEFFKTPVLNIRFYHITNQITDCFSFLDSQEVPELKSVSLGLMFTRYSKVRVYFVEHEGAQLLCVFTNVETSPRIMRKTVAALPFISSWCEDLKEYFVSLLEDDTEAFEKAFTEWYGDKTFLEDVQFENLKNIFKQQHSRSIADATSVVESTKTEITRTEHALIRYYSELVKAQRTLTLRKYTASNIQAEFDSFVNLLKTKTNLHNFAINANGEIAFSVSEPVVNYSYDAAEITFNKSDVWAELVDPEITNAFKAIFLADSGYTLYCRANFYLDTANTKVGQQSLSLGELPQCHGIPNPHLEEYDCWGENKPFIEKHLYAGDYAAAVLQACATLSSINFYDSSVMESWASQLDTNDDDANWGQYLNAPCVLTPNGDWISVSDLAIILAKENPS